jgi:NLI interacting factor-like phosphatase
MSSSPSPPRDVSPSKRQGQQQKQRLGKRARRKLRHQQKVLTPVEYLVQVAQKAQFTGSVEISPDLLSERGDNEAMRVVSVETRASLAETIPPSTIRVQPLLVLDLNGILCVRYRSNKTDIKLSSFRSPLTLIAHTPIITRTDLHEFISFLDKHFCLAIWTSAQRKNATKLVKALLPEHIQNRLLFLWDQSHCVEWPLRDKYDIPLFVKDLSRVWKEYPLWNTSNTILMDDSPSKCFYWRENAVHPPTLNGLCDAYVNRSDEHELDEDNQEMQVDFFYKLVNHWERNPACNVWDEETGDAVVNGQVATQMDFLRHYAVGHMGWDPPAHWQSKRVNGDNDSDNNNNSNNHQVNGDNESRV